MSRFGRLVSVSLALVASGTVALAQPHLTALEILRRSIESRSTVDFSGLRSVVVFDGGTKLHGVRQQIDCKAPDRLRILVLAPESEKGTLCITNGRVQWHYDPTTGRAVRAELAPPRQTAEQRVQELERLAKRMRLQYVGEEEIAGRRTHVVKVYTSEGLLVKKSWVDAEHFVTLKTQRFDSHGRVKSSAFFTRITYNPALDPSIFDFEPPADCTVIDGERPCERMPLSKAEKQAGFRAVLPRYLPPGYRFQPNRAAVIEMNGQPVLWLSFSNGADTFSLFQRPGSGPREPVQRGRSMTWQEGGFVFTLLGTLAQAEMQKVQSAIRP